MGAIWRVRYVSIYLAFLCLTSLAVAQDTFTITGANPDNFLRWVVCTLVPIKEQ